MNNYRCVGALSEQSIYLSGGEFLNASPTELDDTEVFLIPQGQNDTGTSSSTSMDTHPMRCVYEGTGSKGPWHQVVDAQPESNLDYGAASY